MKSILNYDYIQNKVPASRIVGERNVDGLIERLTILTMPDGTLQVGRINPSGKVGQLCSGIICALVRT